MASGLSDQRRADRAVSHPQRHRSARGKGRGLPRRAAFPRTHEARGRGGPASRGALTMANSNRRSAALAPPRPSGPAHGLARALIPLAVATMGAIDLWSALLSHPPERLRALLHLIPTEVLDTSRTFTLIAGALLLVTAWGLRRGKRRAFVAPLFLCAVSVPVNMLKALDVEEATVAAAMMFLLGVSGDAFRVKSREVTLRDLASASLVFAAAYVLYAVGGAWFVSIRYGMHPSLQDAAA